MLGQDCVNDVCSALKNQSSIEGAKCTKQTQVLGEDVGRGGQCKSCIPLYLEPPVISLGIMFPSVESEIKSGRCSLT